MLNKIFQIIFLLLIFSSVGLSQNRWIKKTVPTQNNLRMISYADSLKVWVAGDSGTVIHTTDSGNTWTSQNTGIFENIHHIFFLNERLGWGLAWMVTKNKAVYGTRIIETTNGGLNWSNHVFSEENTFINSIVFLDSLNGWLGGYPGGLLKTTNGGVNWNSVIVDSSIVAGFPIKSISFYNSMIGYACGGFMDLAGVIWKTTNYGINWQAIAVAPEPLAKIQYISSTNVIFVGGDFEYGPGIVRTRDGGNSWSYKTMELFGIPTSIAMRAGYEVWVPMGFIPMFVYSVDTLNSFTEISTPDSSYIFDIVFTNPRIGFCTGDSGALYKFNPDITFVNNNNLQIPADYELFQNYPNPFNPATKIKYQISKPGRVLIIVYDALGRELGILTDKYRQPGIYEVEWNASKFSSGVYFFKISVNDFYATKSMMLIK
ncbi:MAG TPA: YCF48-related protein [Ignavibacteria bacterium]